MNDTIVVVNIYLRSINDIDDYKMEFSVQVTFREQWNDERLKFDDVGGKYFFSFVVKFILGFLQDLEKDR